jgi:polysaccharide pyruvyl transferase WcaK-like protein
MAAMTERDTLLQHVPPGSRVLVVAAVGTGNIGDEAMLNGLLTRLGGRYRVTVASADPEATRSRHGVAALSPSSAIRGLSASDAVIIGGGSLFTRAMGARGRLIPLFGLVAIASRKPVSLVGVSLERDVPSLNGPLLRTLVRKAAEVRVRDAKSASRASTWGAEAVVEPDLSSWMPAQPLHRARELLMGSGVHFNRPIVGLCLTAVDPPLAERLRNEIPQVVAAMPELQFVLLPMSQHPTARDEDDLRFAQEIARTVPALPVLPAALDPRDVLGLFGAFDAAVCMRYHSLLFAHRSRLPVVAIPYADKCTIWLAEQGLPAYPADANAIVAALVSALERPPARRASSAGKAATR